MYWAVLILIFLLASVKTSNASKNNKKKPSVSIVIPAYNEEKTVAGVIAAANELSYVDEVIVVDDGSYDKTADEAKFSGSTVISHATNQGKGAAIKTGFKHSKGDIIAFIDADIQNLTSDKIDNIIRPILDGKTDITKTKFIRESGRVTELTAKPLLKFFFPEITFDQPLSGQFAGKRSVLDKIKFEKDYGVDVGIVLDADAHGININEVDIGDIKHDMSPLNSLNEMANEVVRTIINRAIEYGRVTMMDTLGNYIRMATLGLSLIILGLFTIFFVRGIPLEIGVGITLIGIILTIYYLVCLVIKTVAMFRNKSRGNFLRSFIKMHFPVLISALVLILMISTFLSAATISDGKVSIEPTSRNLVIFPGSPDQAIYVRGPYSVDSALENEIDIIRMPQDALNTLELNYGDVLTIDGEQYTVNETRIGEENLLRLPSKVRTVFNVQIGDMISDGNIKGVFEGIQAQRSFNSTNLTSSNVSSNLNFVINAMSSNGVIMAIYLDNKLIDSVSGAIKNNSSYDIQANGIVISSIIVDDLKPGNSYFAYYGDHIIELKILNKTSTLKNFDTNDFGPFLSFNFDY
ncbi:glucosyl-3-phosphoglycerate synthase [Methanobrevibacter cuticularis]|uniref:Glucosyl-3-phosphoglycerate synthase n=1 Tax=Methanobrevibacter cuticularis TaxID=47311 RepID=A0A166D0J5_9EURY|nr:glycosyltransferase [Methanobrevibacter cuticularis]KZX15074.1 glucosyl-3-phosphoglycerate synthase [Methanobrevibacter cuticularis]